MEEFFQGRVESFNTKVKKETIERKLLKKDIAPSNVFNIISQNVTILSEFVNL